MLNEIHKINEYNFKYCGLTDFDLKPFVFCVAYLCGE